MPGILTIKNRPSGGGGYVPSESGITTDKQPNMPTVAKMSVLGMVQNGNLTAIITEQMARDAIQAAQHAARKSARQLTALP